MINVKELVQKMTLEEKCAMCSGVTNWNTTPIKRLDIPAITMSDGPHGLRREKENPDVANIMQESNPATCFPTAVTLASSWDRNLASKMGKAIAEECIDQKVDIVLGPGINIKRNPRCGRNFEYMSEDPFLAGEIGASYVNGVQNENIGTSLKHYAVNSQEYKRMTSSSELDERTLREIYLPAFENTVKKAQPYTIMCSYNKINGVYASDHKHLLNDILREQWGYENIVISDWGATNDRVAGVKYGMDVEMPTSNGVRDAVIKEAVESGKLAEEDLDRVVERILSVVYKCIDNREKNKGKIVDYDKNYEVACEVAENGAVLLKNDGILPLKKGGNVAVIGSMAKVMRYQGTGSSRINPKKLTSFVDYLNENGIEYEYADGYSEKDEQPNYNSIAKAVNVAKDKDIVIAFVGLTDIYESEGFDREHINIPDAHNYLINELLKVNKNVVIVLAGGSPMVLPWANDVRAILNMYLCGEAGGKATYNLLYGNVNPSGKLAETFPMSGNDNPAQLYFKMGPRTVEYREGIYVGYRYYDKTKKEVLYPFGYGLSYTQFKYSDLKLSAEKINSDETLTVTFNVTNVGDVDGAEVAQVYVKDTESTIYREEKSLKGFEKVYLKAGESKEINIILDKRSFAFYNVNINDWCVESGEFEILVGASSQDIKLSSKVYVDGITDNIPKLSPSSFYLNPIGFAEIPDKDFIELLGRDLTGNAPYKKGEIDENASVEDLGTCSFGKFFRWLVGFAAPLAAPKGSPDAMKKMLRQGALDLPLRNMYAMTNGIVPKASVDGLIKRCNSYPFRGMGQFVGSFLKKRPTKKDQIYPIK